MENVSYSFSHILLTGCERNWSYFRRVQPIVVRQTADNRTLQLQSIFWKKSKDFENMSTLESMTKKFKRMLALSGERETLFYALNREPILSKDAFLSDARSRWILFRMERQRRTDRTKLEKLDEKMATLLVTIDATRSLMYSSALPGMHTDCHSLFRWYTEGSSDPTKT